MAKQRITMKYLLTILILSLSTVYGQMDADRYDTSYYEEYLVSINENGTALIKPIIEMKISVTKQVPCHRVYKWGGTDKDSLGWYSCGDEYDSTKTYGPCGFSGIFEMYQSKYKGDTVIDIDCKSWVSEDFKTLYFIPNKKKKHKLGKQYELQKNDHLGIMDEWNKPPELIWCI